MKIKIIASSFWAIVFAFFSYTEIKAQQYDYVIKGATVFDGSGKDSVVCDVAIAADKIVFVGQLKNGYTAKSTIEGKGLYLSPGFIDPHTHYEPLLKNEKAEERVLARAIMQGVTTVFMGNDGNGPLPIGKALADFEKNGIGPNAAYFVGHNQVRKTVLGEKNVQPTAAQLNEMEVLVAQGMKDGAFGISTGLFYTPGNFARTEEVIALSKVAAQYGGTYDTHPRDEGSQNVGVINSTKEILNIGYQTGIPLHISHLKITGPGAWHKRDSVVYLIEKAQKEGIKVTANQYPYIASQTSLSAAVVPAWVRDGGLTAMRKRFIQPELRDSIIKGINTSIQNRTGDPAKLIIPAKGNRSVQAIANELKVTPEEAVIQLCTEANPTVISYMMREEDVETLMKKPWVMTGSDGGSGHPRAYGAYARIIEEYAQKRKVMSISRAIHRSSYLVAQTLNVKNRGLVKDGFYADLFLFNPSEYKANSSFEKGDVLASGVKYVWVNGKMVVQNGNLQIVLNGKSLRLNNQ